MGWFTDGLLDTYFPRMMRAKRDEQFRGLLGESPMSEPNPGGVMSYGMDPTLADSAVGSQMSGGTGLRGGLLSDDQFFEQIGGLGGRYTDWYLGHQSAAKRAEQARNNISAYQQEALGIQQEDALSAAGYRDRQLAASIANQDRQYDLAVDKFDFLKDTELWKMGKSIQQTLKDAADKWGDGALDLVSKIITPAENATKAYTDLIDQANVVTDLIRDGGIADLSNVEQIPVMNAFNKLMKPNEAINEGDIAIIMESEGTTAAQIMDWAASLFSGSKLTPPQLGKMINVMNKLGAKVADRKAEKLRPYKEILENTVYRDLPILDHHEQTFRPYQFTEQEMGLLGPDQPAGGAAAGGVTYGDPGVQYDPLRPSTWPTVEGY